MFMYGLRRLAPFFWFLRKPEPQSAPPTPWGLKPDHYSYAEKGDTVHLTCENGDPFIDMTIGGLKSRITLRDGDWILVHAEVYAELEERVEDAKWERYGEDL